MAASAAFAVFRRGSSSRDQALAAISSWSGVGWKRDLSAGLSSSLVASSGATDAESARLKTVADQKRKYDQQIAKLRKSYAADFQQKRLQKEKVEAEQRKNIEEQRAIRVVTKKERAAARAIEMAEEQRALQALVKEYRAQSAANRARMDGRHGYVRFKRMEAVRRQSSMWIEKKDLERRILDAIANPYQLAGSSGSEPADRDDSYYEADEP